MKDVIDDLRQRAKKKPKRIVFPEYEDNRVLKAVEYIKYEGIADPIILTKDNIDGKRQDEFANSYFERKKSKGITLEQAKDLMSDPIYYGAMMCRYGYADGFVAGARYTTSSVIRTALRCLELDKAARIVSSCFIMVVPDCVYGEKGVFVCGDCGIIPYPTSSQLASIAISCAGFAKDVLDIIPRVALLSFSTKGSSKHVEVDKVREAVEIANAENSGFLIDGELQADSALVPEVAAKKISNSEVAGKANVLIFPNLDAGNISYKLIQRLAKAKAVGPIVLGTKQPCSDLSRGCTVEDIIDCTAITVLRAQKVITNTATN